MKCEETRKYITDYILKELEPEFEIQVNEHLAVCAKCRGEMQHTEALVNDFRDSVGRKPAASVYERIAKEIRVPKAKQHARLFGLPRSLVLAFGAFVLGIVITKAIDSVIINVVEPSRTEVRQEAPRKVPFSDTVEFYPVPAKNLVRI